MPDDQHAADRARIDRLEQRERQLCATNGALMNEIDRLQRRIAELSGWTPGPEPDRTTAVSADSVDWTRVEVRKLGHGDQPWRLYILPEQFEVHELVPYPGRTDLPPFWSPMRYARKAEALAVIVTMRHRQAKAGEVEA